MRLAPVAAFGLLLTACASGAPIGTASLSPRVSVAPSSAVGFPGTVPADEPGPVTAVPVATTGQPDGLVPGAVVYSTTDPVVVASHSPTALSYAMVPPVGGPHYPVWLNCGIYETPVPTGYAVHDMEHGAVWITYRPDVSDTDVAALEDFVRRARNASINGTDTGQKYLTLSPLPGQTAPVVLSAWAHQLALPAFDTDAMRRFVRAYRTTPGVTPELGASCEGTPEGVPIP